MPARAPSPGHRSHPDDPDDLEDPAGLEVSDAENTLTLPAVGTPPVAEAVVELTREMPAINDTDLVVDLALEIGEVQLAAGASAAQVTTTVESVMHAYGLLSCAVDVTYTSLTASWRSPVGGAATQLRVVRQRSQDYTRLVSVNALVRRILRDECTPTEAGDLLTEILAASHPYRRRLAVGAWGAMAAGVAVTFGAKAHVAAASFIVAVVIYLVTHQAAKLNLPPFLSQFAGGAVAVTGAAGTAAVLAHFSVPAWPALIVVSGIIILLAGVTFVGAIADALTGFYVTSSARVMEVLLLTGGLLAGVSLGLDLAARAGVTFAMQPPTTLTPHVPTMLTAAGVTAAAYAYACYAPKRAVLPAFLAGAIAQLVSYALTNAGVPAAWTAAVAALAVGFFAHTCAGLLRIPGLVTTAAGIIPLLPGLMIYRGLGQLSDPDDSGGVVTLLTAAAVAAAIAAGVQLGERLAYPVHRLLRLPDHDPPPVPVRGHTTPRLLAARETTRAALVRRRRDRR